MNSGDCPVARVALDFRVDTYGKGGKDSSLRHGSGTRTAAGG